MKKYRFKTKEEFIRDGLWDEEHNCPNSWAVDEDMNKYLGIDIPEEFSIYCDKNSGFEYDDWIFSEDDYVLKEQQEYFDDLSQHIGRYIRALVDNPHSGSGVKKGDVGKIISDSRADFPNRKSYHCTFALSKNHLGVRYELLPEDYSPKQKTTPERISFYVKYTEEFTEDLYNALWEWSKKNSEFSPRGLDDSYEGLKIHKFYIFDNWTLNCHGIYGNDRIHKYSYGVDNNKQNCKEEYSIEQVKKLIGYKEPNVEFIPGKWYSFNWDWSGKDKIVIAKIKEVTDIDIIVNWRNYTWNKADYNTNDGYNLSEISNVKELSIEEIQPYLPEGHPDKFTNSKFEIGKWYKWYQKNHENHHYGKVKRIEIETDTIVMTPWIIQCDDYNHSGTFDLSKAEQIQEISIEQIQEFLPNSHPDKITSDVFKKGEYIVITDRYSGGFCTNYIYKQREDYKYLRSELDNKSSKTNGLPGINKNNSDTWRYATQEEIDEYERRGKPYDVTELHKKQLSMKEIQEECKKRFPIGCTFTNTKGKTNVLRNDSYTYHIIGQTIWAHSGGGLLYADGKYATLVSLPEESITEIPEYIECTETQESYFIKGNIYKVIDSKNLASARLVSNIELSQIPAGTSLFCSMEINDKKYWKPSTKEKYDQQKTLSYESVSGCFPIDKTMFIFDEVGQFPSTFSDYWKNISKFVEKEFDIYGPTPDIE